MQQTGVQPIFESDDALQDRHRHLLAVSHCTQPSPLPDLQTHHPLGGVLEFLPEPDGVIKVNVVSGATFCDHDAGFDHPQVLVLPNSLNSRKLPTSSRGCRINALHPFLWHQFWSAKIGWRIPRYSLSDMQVKVGSLTRFGLFVKKSHHWSESLHRKTFQIKPSPERNTR